MPENELKKLLSNTSGSSNTEIPKTNELSALFSEQKDVITKSPQPFKSPEGKYDLDVSEYSDYLDDDVFVNAGLDEARAQAQGRFAKLGSGLVNAVTQTTLDIVKDSSYLLDIENYTNFKDSAEEGFGNWLATAMTSAEEKLKLPVYRTKESEGFSPWSAGWWGDNIPSILSTVAMAVPAQGAIKGLGLLGKVMGGEKIIKGIEAATGISKGLISSTTKGVGAAVISRQMEAIMEGSQTYDETFKQAMEKPGMTEEEAKVIAGEAAANNYKLNWAALVQDIPEYLFLNKAFKESSKIFSLKGAKEATKIGLIEGSEEAYQYITDKESSRAALIKGDVIKDDSTSFGDRMTEYATDGDFWTSAFLGALGGAGFGAYGVHKDKSSQQSFNGLLAAHKGIITGDPNTYYRAQDQLVNDKITTSIADGNLENFKEGINAILSNPERVRDEDKGEVSKRLNNALDQIEYAENIGKDILNDGTLSPDLKKLSFQTKLDQRAAENRLQEINTKLAPLQAKDYSLTNATPDVLAYKEAKLTAEGAISIPNLAKEVKEIQSRVAEVGKELVDAYPEKYKTIEDLNKSIISSHDEEMKKLLTNRLIENEILKGAKDLTYLTQTDEGKEALQKKIDKAKEKQAKEVKVQEEKQLKTDITSFASKIAQQTDPQSFTPEEQQFYDNNKQAIEKELQTLQEAQKSPISATTSTTRESKVQKEVVTEKDPGTLEAPEVINTPVLDDDNTSKKANTIFKSTTGPDDGQNQSRELFYRTVESIPVTELVGKKLLVVTKETNPSLYSQILDQDPEAKEFERLNKDYKGIWTILVNEDGSPYLVDGKFIQSTLETAKRVLHPTEGLEGVGAVDVARGIEDAVEALKTRENAIESINKLRDEILTLKSGESRYLEVIDKSKGLIEDEGHSAFEPKDANGNRQSNTILGRIFKTIKDWSKIPLELAILSPEWKGVRVLKGKLYIQGDNGRVFDLVPRLLNGQEVELIYSLIQKKLNTPNLDFNPIDEVKKIISFKGHKTDPRFQMYINQDGNLVIGDNPPMTKEVFNTEAGSNQVLDFLETKRTNVNNKYIVGEAFTTPDLNGRGKKIDYKEYLLSGETPMFGTDLKQGEIDGQPTKRFIQTYLIYNPVLITNDKLAKPEVKAESKVIENTTAPIVPVVETVKPKRTKRSKDTDRRLDRLKSIAKDGAKLTQKEIDWFNSNFPNIPIKLVKGLIEGQSLGQFLSAGEVLLSDEATTGTLYHEAFHTITQLYLTKEEIDRLYAEAAITHPNKTRKELEEILAEDFVKYKETKQVLGNQPVRNSLFRRILNIIRDFLGLSVKDVQQIYERLDKGYYTNKKIVGIREFSSLNRDEDTKRITKEKGTKFVKDVLDSLDVMFFRPIYVKGKTPIAIINHINKISDWIHDDLIDLIDSTTDPVLLENYLYIVDNFDSFIKIWTERLNSNGIELVIEEKETPEQLEENQSDVIKRDNNSSKGDQYAEGNLTSTLESVASPVRMLLMSLEQVNKDGSIKLNDLKLPSTVDFKSTYTYLLKNTVGIGSSYTDLYNKIQELKKVKPEFQQLLNVIEPPSTVLDDEKMRFQTQFLQTFNKTRTNSLITTYDGLGNIRIIDANRQNEADKVKTDWENKLIQYTTQDAEGNLIVDMKILEIKKPLDFLAKLGITFDEPTKDIINSKTFDDKELNDAVSAIKLFIQHHKGRVNDLYVQVKDNMGDSEEVKAVKEENKKFSVAGGRLNYLLNLEAKYTSLVNELSFISADNKTEYSVGENNGLSITINSINNAKSLDDLYAKLPHLNTIGVQGSLWMKELFNATTGLKNEGIKLELELHNGINTAKEADEDIKKPTRKGTKGDLYTQQIASILNGKSSFIVSSDKSQEFIVSLNYYNGNQKLPVSIESLKDGFNTIALKSIFQDYFKAEVTRIAKFELDGLGEDVDIYRKNGSKWSVFQEILGTVNGVSIKKEIDTKLKQFKEAEQDYDDVSEELDTLVTSLLPILDVNVIKFFEQYQVEATNALRINKINDNVGLPKDLTSKYSFEQLIRAIVVTDFINSVEQTKLIIGDLTFYKDLYKRTAMFAGTKQLPRIDSEFHQWMNTIHPRKDGKLADGYENTIVYSDVTTEKKNIEDLVKAYTDEGYSAEEAYSILGYKLNDKGEYVGDSAYGKADEGDAQGWGSLDFIMEFHRSIGTNTPLMEEAYNIIQKQVFNDKRQLIEGELLNKDQVALFKTLKLQYAGPINARTSEIYIPGGYKFTVMPLIPQMIAGKNLSKMLKNMQDRESGIALFKSGSKFGTIVHDNGKANNFYVNGNNGEITSSENLITQSISYQYLGLQVKPSDPSETGIFSTQFRKTIFINAFNGGKETFEGAKDLLDRFNSLIEQRTSRDKDKLVKELGINPESKKIGDFTKLVDILVKSAEDRKLTDNIIDSLDVETVDGKQQLKYSISSMINKAKIDSVLMSLIDSRLIKQKFNGDAYVLASVAGMEALGRRNIGSNNALRGYTKGKDGKTLPAQVMIPMTENYYPLLKKYKTLKGVNEAITNGEIDAVVLELVGCRIPGQGMNSNEYLTIKEFLPEDSATTMIAHPDIVAKAGSDFDNDKLYTYRPNLDEDGGYKADNLDNKLIDVVKTLISHPSNFLSLITPNSTDILTSVANEIKYNKYVNKKRANNEEPVSLEAYIKSQKNLADNIKYTDSLKLNKKIDARYKLWLAKDEVGPSAIANAYGPLSQIAGLTANKQYTLDGKLKFVKINLPHNIKEELVNLGAVSDALDENDISEVNNQMINIIVDAAKDEEPLVAHLNITMETLPVYLYLNKMGVPFKHVANFMAQPIISEYLEANTANNSVFLKVTGKNKKFGVRHEIKTALENKIRSNIGVEPKNPQKHEPTEGDLKFFKYISENTNKEIPLKDLQESQLSGNQAGKEYDLLQFQVFNDFLQYKEQAQLFGDYVRITNSDSAGLGQNINSERIKQAEIEKTLATGFINGIENVINNTFVKSFNQGSFAISTYKDLYDTQREDVVEMVLSIANRIEQKQIDDFKGKMTKEAKTKLINTIENDFINYIVQNYGYSNIDEFRNSLFKGENSVAKQLLALKTKEVSKATDDELKLKKNILIEQLFPLIDKARSGTGYDNVKIFTKRIATFESNQLTRAFREIQEINPDLGAKLIDLGILQSGLNNSPITYLGIIPFEYYNNLVKEAFSEFNKKNGAIDLIKFEQLFNLNRSNKMGYGMYGKDFDASKAKTRKLPPSVISGFSTEIEESISFDEAKPSDMKQETIIKSEESEIKPKVMNFKKSTPVLVKAKEVETSRSLKNAEVNRLLPSTFKTKLFDDGIIKLKKQISLLNNKNKREDIDLVYTIENIKSAGGSLFTYEIHEHMGKLDVKAKIERAKPEGELTGKAIELEQLLDKSLQLDLFSEMNKVSDEEVEKRIKKCE